MQIKDYDYPGPGVDFSEGNEDNSHKFTALMWQDTTDIGCAYKTCTENGKTIIVCMYNPPGNVKDKEAFQELNCWYLFTWKPPQEYMYTMQPCRGVMAKEVNNKNIKLVIQVVDCLVTLEIFTLLLIIMRWSGMTNFIDHIFH